MLYKIEWELISWVGMCSYLVELSPEDRDNLEAYFEHEREIHKLMGYRITPADIKSLENIFDIHFEDKKAEEELDKKIDEENNKKGA